MAHTDRCKVCVCVCVCVHPAGKMRFICLSLEGFLFAHDNYHGNLYVHIHQHLFCLLVYAPPLSLCICAYMHNTSVSLCLCAFALVSPALANTAHGHNNCESGGPQTQRGQGAKQGPDWSEAPIHPQEGHWLSSRHVLAVQLPPLLSPTHTHTHTHTHTQSAFTSLDNSAVSPQLKLASKAQLCRTWSSQQDALIQEHSKPKYSCLDFNALTSGIGKGREKWDSFSTPQNAFKRWDFVFLCKCYTSHQQYFVLHLWDWVVGGTFE